VVACGHLRVAISTSGVAPALSGFMKEDMEKIFGEEFAAFVDWLGQLREHTKASEPDFENAGRCCVRRWMGFACWQGPVSEGLAG